MQFHVDFSTLSQTLPIMLWGMGGIIVVMAVICVVLVLLYRFGKRK